MNGKKCLRYIAKGTSIVFFVFCFCYFLCMVFPKFTGVQIGIVKSGSMEPSIPTGSVVYIKKQPLDEIKEGDIISFRLGEGIVIHRVVEYAKDEKGFVTKGDNNEKADIATVFFEQVTGKVVFHIPYIGYVHTWFKNYILLRINSII